MSDLKDTFMKITRGVTKTSGELLKSTKLSLTLASEEDKLKQIYMEIGKKVHEIYQYGGSLGKFFDEKYAEIQKAEAGIQDLKNQMDVIKGVKTCPKCGAGAERGAGFCPKCGVPLDTAASVPASAPVIPEPAAKPDPPPPKRETLICRNCQSENEPGSKFCLTCGRLL